MIKQGPRLFKKKMGVLFPWNWKCHCVWVSIYFVVNWKRIERNRRSIKTDKGGRAF